MVAWIAANWKVLVACGGVALIPLALKYINKLDRAAWRKILTPIKIPVFGAGVAISKILTGIPILKGYGQHVEDALQVTLWNLICVIVQDQFFAGLDSDDRKLSDIVRPTKEKVIPEKPVPKAISKKSAAKFTG